MPASPRRMINEFQTTRWVVSLPEHGTIASGRKAAVEAPAIVAGLDDVAVVGEPVEERIGHLGVAEDGGPFAWRYS
jgi:hypothetical protein